ncbi:MAG: hypothetical protein H0X37_01540 [Herpetosiphonaceae bacterium]|nr:hypothetical protein [Herpetosiphonaceae bacterium]
MVRSWLLLSLVGVWAVSGWLEMVPSTVPQVQSARWVQSELDDWLPGTFTNTYVEGSVLRLQPGQLSGAYQSAPFRTAFPFNGAVVETVVHATVTQTLTVEVRGSLDGQQWLAWQPFERAADANERTLGRFLAFQPFTMWLQYRIRFGASADSPEFDEIAITYISSVAGPALVDLKARPNWSGPPTLTPPPDVISRNDWSGGGLPAVAEHQQPQRIEISQVQVPAEDANSAATMRALQWAATNLYGQTDLPFHYLVNARGTVFEGQSSADVRLSVGEPGIVRIGLLTDVEHAGMSEVLDQHLTGLLAWLSEAYHISSTAMSAAQDAPLRLQERLSEYHAAAEHMTVHWQRFFPEGSPGNGLERLVLLNSEERDAYVTLIGYTSNSQQRHSLVVPHQQRLELTLNMVFPGVDVLGLQVLADQPLVAERTQLVKHEALSSSGLATPLRTWYFATGDTTDGTQTYLLVINPTTTVSTAELTFYPEDSVPLTKTIALAPEVRSTISLNDLLPNERFAWKLNATQPVVAERSIFTATGAASLGMGLEQLSRRWLFAEGTTTNGYTTTLHFLNPWPQRVAISVQVLTEDGTTVSRRYAVTGLAPLVLSINEIAPDVPFALDIQAERPLATEREIVFGNGRATTIGRGAVTPQTRWIFAEGSTAAPAEQFLLVANPAPVPVSLDVSYTLANGSVRHHSRTMPGTARLTIAVASDVPNQQVVSITIIASRPIVAERSLYLHNDGEIGGETTLGTGAP